MQSQLMLGDGALRPRPAGLHQPAQSASGARHRVRSAAPDLVNAPMTTPGAREESDYNPVVCAGSRRRGLARRWCLPPGVRKSEQPHQQSGTKPAYDSCAATLLVNEAFLVIKKCIRGFLGAKQALACRAGP